jgi:hypothetical protein
MSHDGVRVAVRTRPISKKEQGLGSKCCVEIDQARAEVKITDFKRNDRDAERVFTFDFAYDIDSEQVGLYKDLGDPLLGRALVS